jgi:succinoglycan biosynthesis protein ExoL
MKVVVFGFDAAESSQIRRIRSLMGSGHDVVAFTMRRANMNPGFQPDWRNIHLFMVDNERIARRLLVLFLSCFRIVAHRRELRGADVIMARNFDMLLLAHVARLVAPGAPIPIVYECLDIHGSFTREGRAGKVFRWLERFFLSRSQLLVVSSPGFVDNYFRPVQGYTGKAHLLENKIWFGGPPPPRRESADNIADGKPWVLGWVGSLRCEPSFRILLETAARLGDRVKIEMHGNIHRHVLPDFERRIAEHPNIVYHGPYPYPEGLAEVYSACDFVWAQDLWQAGANSDWLLPNRIYEAAYFGCLSIAVAGTQTGRKVAGDALGYTVDAPTPEALITLIASLEPAEVESRRAGLLAKPASDFVYSAAEIDAVLDAARRG